jgi:hypothetical protein
MTEKVRENRLRRKAARQGLMLKKSRRRDPDALDYGGYLLCDISTGLIVAGSTAYPYSLSLDDVEEILTGE